MRTDSGQAMVELALGVFVLALVLSALLAFGQIIPESVRYQSLVRRQAGRDAQANESGDPDGAQPTPVYDQFPEEGNIRSLPPASFLGQRLSFEVSLDPLAETYVFGSKRVRLTEEAWLPPLRIPTCVVEEIK